MPVHTGRRANTFPMLKSCAGKTLIELLTRFCGQHRQIHHCLVQLPRHPTPGIPQSAHRPQAGELGGGAQLLRGFDQQLGICRRRNILQETRVPLRFDVAAGAAVVGALPDVAPGSEEGFSIGDVFKHVNTCLCALKAKTVTRRRLLTVANVKNRQEYLPKLISSRPIFIYGHFDTCACSCIEQGLDGRAPVE